MGEIPTLHTVCRLIHKIFSESGIKEDVATLDGRSGFSGLAEWTANASAGHWGHIDKRTIRFRALVELVDDGGAWKLAGITVTDSRQEM